MHVSILSGRVAEENWRSLEKNFERAVRQAPKSVVSSILILMSGRTKIMADYYDVGEQRGI